MPEDIEHTPLAVAANPPAPLATADDTAIVPADTSTEIAPTETTEFQTPIPEGGFNTPAVVDWVFKEMAWWDEGEENSRAVALRAKWGSDTGANLQHAEGFIAEHPDVAGLFAAAGWQNHPVIIEAAAMMGRRYAVVPGDPAFINPGSEQTTMTKLSDDNFAEAMEDFQSKINEALAAGKNKKANRLSEEQRELIERQQGDQHIVGRGGRTA